MDLPTLYEYYTGHGITSGLSAENTHFTLNNRSITLYSGSMHYFRIPREYWRDRLRKMRAAGLNTIETYIPWNLHEPQPGVYDFGSGGTDFEDFLNIGEFLKTVKEEDLFAIVRPGPYICAEWEFGGLPSWLLKEKNIIVRSADPKFMKHVTRYFKVLLPILAFFQFTRGGPIIGFQIENEYGNVLSTLKVDKVYMMSLRDLMIDNGIVEQLFTSDAIWARDRGSVPGALMTVNLHFNATYVFDKLSQMQPGKPLMAMEFWAGWFDRWNRSHVVTDIEQYFEETITYPASVNLYMFCGGTNFGFMNGATFSKKALRPVVTSYDYSAPINEGGRYTNKYYFIQSVLEEFNPVKTRLPTMPKEMPVTDFPTTTITEHLNIIEIIDQASVIIQTDHIMPMELLQINDNSGQSYGYIVYRKMGLSLTHDSILRVEGEISDTVLIFVNGVMHPDCLVRGLDAKDHKYWLSNNLEFNLGIMCLKNCVLDIVVENWGRINTGPPAEFIQHKGLQGFVMINNKVITEWEIIPLEFKKRWTRNLKWHTLLNKEERAPGLYRAILPINYPQDTYLDMRNWQKGIVIINGFVLGRYCTTLGPQLHMYLPAPLLKKGNNEIVIFEHFFPGENIMFRPDPLYTVTEKVKWKY